MNDIRVLKDEELKQVSGGVQLNAFAVPDENGEKYYRVKMTAISDNTKVAVIKKLRGLTDLGLKEAKHTVENLPTTICDHVLYDKAMDVYNSLIEAGALCYIEEMNQ